MKYTGPAKPIPTKRSLMSDKALAICFIVLAVVFIVIMVLT
jgi:hypothetical protein